MKYGSRLIAILSFSLLLACASHKANYQEASLTLPELGSIVQAKGKLWYATTEQVGKPIWDENLVVTVQELPFNKASYVTYASFMANAGKINGIPYVDSLPYKPKYIRLQLLDKIGTTAVLNNKANTNVREYLENDEAYKLVTHIDMSVPDAMIPELLGANRILLVEDAQLGKHLVLTRGIQESKINLADVQIFNYGLSSFCWGEDRYHNKKIETILSGNSSCPKGTFKKAAKVTSDKSYLKF